MSFKGHSINSFKAPLSQFSIDEAVAAGNDEDEAVQKVIKDNERLDEQLTDMFKAYCDKFQPIGAPKMRAPGIRSSGMTQCKHTLRKVRNICTEAWLKEP